MLALAPAWLPAPVAAQDETRELIEDLEAERDEGGGIALPERN